jgi:hypothetical protein
MIEAKPQPALEHPNGIAAEGDKGWMKASLVLDHILTKGIDPTTAKANLADDLRDGRLRAKATVTWVSNEPLLSKAWKSSIGGELRETNVEIPTRYWRQNKNIVNDIALWRWPVNCFAMTIKNKPKRRRMMRGISLSIEDLANLYPTVLGGLSGKRRRGPGVNHTDRDAGWRAIVEMALEGKLSKQAYARFPLFHEALIEKLQLENGKSRLGRDQTRAIATIAYRLAK